MKLLKLFFGIVVISSFYLLLIENQQILLPERFVDQVHERDLDPTALFYTESAIPSSVYFNLKLKTGADPDPLIEQNEVD